MALTQISTNGIKDSTIATADIANDAVSQAKIAASAIHTENINDNAVTAAKLASDAVTTNKIEDGAVTAAKLASGIQTTINNNANNRVMTGEGSMTLNGEANLTFDGGNLVSKGDNGITIEATTNNTAGLFTVIGKNNSGQVSAITRVHSIPENSSNAATSTTISNRDSSNNVNEHMRITSAGDVGIGLTNPNRRLYISQSSTASYSSSGEGGSDNHIVRIHNPCGTDNSGVGYHTGLEIAVASGANTFGYLGMVRTGNNTGDFFYKTRTGGTSYAERFRILNSGGITFNGDTAEANALDDYEEGAFSATLVGQYGGNANYSYRNSYYTRIGRVVHVTGDIRFDGSWSGNSGNLYLQLPFGTSFASGGTVGNGSVAEWNLSNSNWDYIGIQVDNNSANARFTTHSGSNNNTSSLQTGELGNGRYLKFGFTYITS